MRTSHPESTTMKDASLRRQMTEEAKRFCDANKDVVSRQWNWRALPQSSEEGVKYQEKTGPR
jgi:hypothetical protein